jgi:hypothetical protein
MTLLRMSENRNAGATTKPEALHFALVHHIFEVLCEIAVVGAPVEWVILDLWDVCIWGQIGIK